MRFDAAERVADAVFDTACVGCRAGVIAPRGPDGVAADPWFSQTECLVRANDDTLVFVRARFLTLDGERGVKRSADIIPIDVSRPVTRHVSLGIDGLRARLVVEAELARVDSRGARSSRDLAKLSLRLENHEEWRAEFADCRSALLARSLISAHLLLVVEHGEFISLLAPPPDAAVAVAGCTNLHTWPVLAGDPTSRDSVFSSPIPLGDYPVSYAVAETAVAVTSAA